MDVDITAEPIPFLLKLLGHQEMPITKRILALDETGVCRDEQRLGMRFRAT
jgi:hypothetical protein